MDGNSTIQISLLISLILAVITIINFFTSRSDRIKANVEKENAARNQIAKDDEKEKAENSKILSEIKEGILKLNMKSDQQCGQLTDLQATLRSTQDEVKNIREKQIAHDVEIKALWRAVDNLKDMEQKDIKKEGE